MSTLTITHTVEKLTDIFGKKAVFLKVIIGDVTHGIICEQVANRYTETHINHYPYTNWIVRDNCDRSYDCYVNLGDALISYCQVSRAQNEIYPAGHMITMIEEILPYMHTNHKQIVAEIADALR